MQKLKVNNVNTYTKNNKIKILINNLPEEYSRTMEGLENFMVMLWHHIKRRKYEQMFLCALYFMNSFDIIDKLEICNKYNMTQRQYNKTIISLQEKGWITIIDNSIKMEYPFIETVNMYITEK